MSARDSNRVLRERTTLWLEPDGLYWAVLRAPLGGTRRRGLLSPGVDEEALRYAFEPLLPVRLDEVQTRFARLTQGGETAHIGCAIESERLRERIEAHEAGGEPVESATPSGLPEWVGAALPAGNERLCAALEFRTGGFESPRRARRRRRTARLAALGGSAALAVVSLGGFRAAAGYRADAEAARAAADALAGSALAEFAVFTGEADASKGGDPRLRLAALLRAADQARGAASNEAFPADRAATFADALAAWPVDLPIRVEQAVVDQASIAIRGRVRDAGDFERFVERWSGALPGWREQSKSGSVSAEGFGFTLVLQPSPADTAATTAGGAGAGHAREGTP